MTKSKRLFSLTIFEDEKESEIERDRIVKVSFKCGVCNKARAYTTNGYANFFEEIDAMRVDFICECVPK